MPRVSKNTAALDAVKHLMGTLPDHKVAEQAGLTASAVGRYRRKYGIDAYQGYKFGASESEGDAPAASPAPEAKEQAAADESAQQARRGRGKDKKLRKSKLSPFYDELGRVADREIAEKAGVSVEAVRMYRRRHGIDLAVKTTKRKAAAKKPRKRTSKLDPYQALLGKIPDAEVAAKAGVTSENVRSYRRRHNIAAEWRKEPVEAAETQAEAPTQAPAETPVVEAVPVETVAAPEAPAPAPEPAPAAPAATVVETVESVEDPQGFAVSVRVGSESLDYFIVSTDIATAATTAMERLGASTPGGSVVAIRHLGPAIS